jgi:hypothetical protein
MFLNRKDIEKIKDVLVKFPTVDSFELVQEQCSGIGSIVTMSFNHTVNSLETKISVEISGVEDW